MEFVIGIFAVAALFLLDLSGMRSRAWIFTVAGESGIKAYIPVMKCVTYGKIANTKTIGFIEGICSIASKVLLVYGIQQTLVAMVSFGLTFLMLPYEVVRPGIATSLLSKDDIASILLITGFILMAVQWICRGIVRYRFDKAYHIHPAMLVLWVFLPHIAEIIVSQRISSGQKDWEADSRAV